jgi:hypothetical protein
MDTLTDADGVTDGYTEGDTDVVGVDDRDSVLTELAVEVADGESDGESVMVVESEEGEEAEPEPPFEKDAELVSE